MDGLCALPSREFLRNDIFFYALIVNRFTGWIETMAIYRQQGAR